MTQYRKPFSNDKEWIELAGTTLAESAAAVQIDFGDKIKWISKSQMEDWPDKGTSGTVLVKEWIAFKEGLI